MSTVKWMDFSGCPPLLLPERLRTGWAGHALPAEIEYDEDEDTVFWSDSDFVTTDGRGFCLRDEYDYDNPKTDYERLCAIRGKSHFVFPVSDGEAFSVSDYSDGPVGWWPEQQMLVTVSPSLPDPAAFDRLDRKDEIRWNVPPGRLLLLNSCCHAAAPDLLDQFVDFVDLAPGEYSIEAADHAEGFCAMLYRFRRVG